MTIGGFVTFYPYNLEQRTENDANMDLRKQGHSNVPHTVFKLQSENFLDIVFSRILPKRVNLRQMREADLGFN